MRMKRSVYQMDKDKHKKLMKKLIDEDMNFNEFLDRTVNMYLNGKFEVNKKNKEE